jgi:hypothetical protein
MTVGRDNCQTETVRGSQFDCDPARTGYIEGMANILFRVVQQNLSYAVEITEGGGVPYTVANFKSEAAAEAWVAKRAARGTDHWERQPDPDRRHR